MSNFWLLWRLWELSQILPRLQWSFGLSRMTCSGENLFHDNVSVIVLGFTSFAEDRARLFSNHHTFLIAERISFWFFFGSKYQHYDSVFVSSLSKRQLPNPSSLVQLNVRAHLCKTSRLSVKGCNQTGKPCVGWSLCIFVRWFTVHCSLLVMICQHRFPVGMLVTSSCCRIL